MTDALPGVNADGHVEINYSRPARGSLKPHGKLYALPMKGPKAQGEGWIISLDPVGFYVSPRAGIMSASNGMLLILFVLTIGFSLAVLTPIVPGLLLGEVRFGEVLIEIFGAAILAIFASAILVQMVAFDIAYPLLFNRVTGKVVQLQGNKRVEANWGDLRPYLSALTSVGYGGATTNYHLLLAQPTQSGKYVSSQILAKSTLESPHEALRYYELLRRYMEGEWGALPQTYLSNGLRPPFWKEFRGNWWNDWMNRIPWRERADSSRKLLAFTVPLWTTIWWPLIVLTLIGSRMGRIRNLPESDMLAATYNPVAHGAMPSGLMGKVLADPQPERAEKMLYAFSLSLGAFIWVGAIIWWVW